LTVIGKGREVICQYLRSVPNGGDVADFSNVFPETPVCPVLHQASHHAKLHLHLLAPRDPQPMALTEALAMKHPDLRFTLYYETPSGYGTVHGRDGKIKSHVYREQEK
jgi:hypothetical protein